MDWTFNAWGGLKGGLYKDWRDDDLVRRQKGCSHGCGFHSVTLLATAPVSGVYLNMSFEGCTCLASLWFLRQQANQCDHFIVHQGCKMWVTLWGRRLPRAS